VFQFTTLYYQVDDEQTLEDFFSSTHLQLAEQLPGLVKSEVSRVTGQPGGQSRFHLAYSLYFSTEQSFFLSLASEPGIKLMEALKPLADARLIVWYYAEAFEEIVKSRGQNVDLGIAKFDAQSPSS
jgi:uncharacterized protein (TIGR02118 family)